jgi:hypothetical protein
VTSGEREKECPGEARGMHKPHLKVERLKVRRLRAEQISRGGEQEKSKSTPVPFAKANAKGCATHDSPHRVKGAPPARSMVW